jgi:hypothetical protein
MERSMRGQRKRWRRGIALSGGVAVLLCAGAAVPEAAYESATALRAGDLLAPEVRQGPHHVVEDAVISDGLLRVYTLTSDFGRFEARGEDVLRIRIREIEALAVLREASLSPAFEEAAKEAGPSPFVSGRKLGDGPLDLRSSHGAGGVPLLSGPGGADFLGQLAGFHASKRELAHVLGVDPYSSNGALQRALDRHAWVVFAGGAALPSPAGAEGGPAPSDARLDGMLRDYSAEDLEKFNRIELAVMGVPEDLREAFIRNPSYSTSQETVLVEALAALEGTDERAAFIEAAVEADSEDDARGYRSMAQMMRSYAGRADGLDRIVRVEGGIAARTGSGELVVPVRADHALWTRRVAAFAETIARETGGDPELARTRILFSGSVSPDAREGFERLGLAVGEEGLALPAPGSSESDGGDAP